MISQYILWLFWYSVFTIGLVTLALFAYVAWHFYTHPLHWMVAKRFLNMGNRLVRISDEKNVEETVDKETNDNQNKMSSRDDLRTRQTIERPKRYIFTDIFVLWEPNTPRERLEKISPEKISVFILENFDKGKNDSDCSVLYLFDSFGNIHHVGIGEDLPTHTLNRRSILSEKSIGDLLQKFPELKETYESSPFKKTSHCTSTKEHFC